MLVPVSGFVATSAFALGSCQCLGQTKDRDGWRDELDTGIGIVFKTVVNDGKVRGGLLEDVGEFVVLRTGYKFTDEREEKGNLELNLGMISAVEGAVEASIVEGGVEVVDNVGVGGESFFARIERGLFVVTVSGNVGGELASGASEDAGQGVTDSA